MAIQGLTVTAESLGALLTGKPKLTVPMYQRYYSWERKQVDALLDDITVELEKPRKDSRTLFLGTIVFNTESAAGQRTTDLIDGQQRLFTLSLIQLWWIRRLAEIDTQKSGAVLHLMKSLLFNDDVEDLSSLTESDVRRLLRLQSSLHDRQNFESLIRRGKGGQRGRSRLTSAFRVVDERCVAYLQRLAKEKGIQAEPEDPKFWSLTVEVADKICDIMYQRISFGVVEVAPPFNPFAVFESLNSKGLELAQSDLIKNYLLKELGSEPVRQEALQHWDAMVTAVPGEKIVDFLRAWFIAYHRHVQRAALYDAYREHLNSAPRIKESLEDWVRAAWWFRAFQEGKISDNHQEMQGVKIEPAFKRALENWSRLGFKQGLPVLMAMLHPSVCNPTERSSQLRLVDAMRALEAAYVRLFVTGNVRGSVFESRLEKLCHVAKTQKTTAVENLRKSLLSMCDAENVGADLDWSSVSRPISESRFLLYRIAEHQGGNTFQLVGSDRWHVEHIKPQTKPGGHKTEDEQAEYEETVGKIGNLTLLLEGDNVSLGNKPHKEKAPVFGKYDGRSTWELGDDEATRPKLPMNLDIAAKWPDKWDDEAIARRGALLGKYATDVWDLASE